MSFGRKGLTEASQMTPEQRMALRMVSAPQQQPTGDTMSPELAAFLASERANRTIQPGPADYVVDSQPSQAPTAASNTTIIVHNDQRLMILAYVLWWFAAPLGAHRHYLGAHASGFAQMGLWIAAFACMLGGAASNSMTTVLPGIALMVGAVLWFFADAFLIPGMLRRFNDRPSPATFA